MKKTFFSAISIICLVAIIIALPSCGGGNEKQHATSIALPDSTLVGKNLPNINGSLSDYFSIQPEAYSLNLTDSIMSLNVKLRLDSVYKANKYVSVSIANPDSLLSKLPYLVLVDSLGTPVPNFRMEVDSAAVNQLMTLLTDKKDAEVVVPFKALQSYTQEQCDSLADVAVNFSIVANLAMEVDSKSIDKILNNFQAQVNEYRSWRSGGGMGYSFSAMVNSAYQSAKRAGAAAASVVPYMTPEQLSRYNSIKSKL